MTWERVAEEIMVNGKMQRTNFFDVAVGDIVQLGIDKFADWEFVFREYIEGSNIWQHTRSESGSFAVRVDKPVFGIVTDKISKIHTDAMIINASDKETINHLAQYYLIRVTCDQSVNLWINSKIFGVFTGIYLLKWC